MEDKYVVYPARSNVVQDFKKTQTQDSSSRIDKLLKECGWVSFKRLEDKRRGNCKLPPLGATAFFFFLCSYSYLSLLLNIFFCSNPAAQNPPWPVWCCEAIGKERYVYLLDGCSPISCGVVGGRIKSLTC